MERMRNVIMSCVNGAPGSNIEIFRGWMENSFATSVQKVKFICGDFSTDLFIYKKVTGEFINTIYPAWTYIQE